MMTYTRRAQKLNQDFLIKHNMASLSREGVKIKETIATLYFFNIHKIVTIFYYVTLYFSLYLHLLHAKRIPHNSKSFKYSIFLLLNFFSLNKFEQVNFLYACTQKLHSWFSGTAIVIDILSKMTF